MNEHTKGPWTATKHDQHWVRVNVTIKAGGNMWVAFMPNEDKDERMANARLMAAAPDLLDALTDLLHQAKFSKDEGGWDFEQAEVAIAKAKGEA